jgi:hypothetical protein
MIYKGSSFLFHIRVLRDVLAEIPLKVGTLFKTGIGPKRENNLVHLGHSLGRYEVEKKYYPFPIMNNTAGDTYQVSGGVYTHSSGGRNVECALNQLEHW